MEVAMLERFQGLGNIPSKVFWSIFCDIEASWKKRGKMWWRTTSNLLYDRVLSGVGHFRSHMGVMAWMIIRSCKFIITGSSWCNHHGKRTLNKHRLFRFSSRLVISWFSFCFFGCSTIQPKLVGGWATPLKNMKVNWDDDIPKISGNIKNGNQTTNQI